MPVTYRQTSLLCPTTLRRFCQCLVWIGVVFCTDALGSDAHLQAVRDSITDLAAEYNLPSLSVAIGEEDQVVFAHAVGYADVASGQLATPTTQYSVASLAKPMTAVALATLADAGQVDLDATVNTYLSEPAYADQFTIRELAGHLSGIPHDTPEREFFEFSDPQDRHSPGASLGILGTHEPLFSPGTDVYYSSNGYILLSAVIEAAAGKPFADVMQASVWSPARMTDTEPDIATAGLTREASYYAAFDDDNGYTAGRTPRDRSFLFGAGGFLSTPSDLVRLAQATYGDSWLSPEIRDSMATPVLLHNGDANPEAYSLGWQVGGLKLQSGKRWTTLQHAGLMEGAATSYLLVVPECRQAIAFSTNFVPNGFWAMYAEMESLLRLTIDEANCREAVKP